MKYAPDSDISSYLFMLSEDHKPFPAPDVMTWAKWLEEFNRQLMLDRVGSWTVSSVFLGVAITDPPRLFETLVFNGPLDRQQRRYVTWEEMVKGHAEMVKRLQDEWRAQH